MFPRLHMLFLCGITLRYNIHENGVYFQQIEFNLSLNSTVIDTHYANYSHSKLCSMLTLLSFSNPITIDCPKLTQLRYHHTKSIDHHKTLQNTYLDKMDKRNKNNTLS